MAAPTEYPDWATDETNNLAPPPSKVAEGWVPAEEPPSSWFNWWMNLVGLWVRHFVSTLSSQIDLRKVAVLNVTQRSADSYNDDWAGVAFGILASGDRRWVIVGELDEAEYSTDDGRNWGTGTGTTGAGLFRGAAFGADKFVAVGYDGASIGFALPIIYSSADGGSSWTVRTAGGSPPAGDGLNAITYAAGLFVAVGYNGHIQTSPDGITWTKRTAAAADDLLCITHNGTAFVAGGINAANTRGCVQVSTDGITWTQHLLPATVLSVQGIAADADSGQLMAAANLVAATNTTVLYVSSDGATWTLEATLADYPVYSIACMGDGLFVMCGESANAAGFGSAAFLAAGVVGGVWSVVPAPHGETLWALGRGGDKIVVVGSGGFIADSAHGVI